MHPTESLALTAIADICPAIAVTIGTDTPISINIQIEKADYEKMTDTTMLSVIERLKPYFPLARHLRYCEGKKGEKCIGEVPIRILEKTKAQKS